MQNNFKDKRIVFWGTPDFTVDFLNCFRENGFNIVGVITGEDKPFGRGMQMKKPGPKVWAEKNNMEAEEFGQIPCQIFQPQKLDGTVLTELEKLNPDLYIVIAYGKIIPERFIHSPKHGTINLHYSLLPKYRGASPVESAILNNEERTGISIQQMVYELDAGDILFEEEMEIEKTDTTSDLRGKLNKRALEIFPEFLEKLFTRNISKVKQDATLSTKCGKFSKEDFNVTDDLLSNNFKKVFTKYKAFDKKIFFFHKKNDSEIRVKITDMNENEILKVLPESRKEITYSDFLRSFT